LEGGHACVPDLNDFPSTKRLVISRGTLAAGTAGVGYILISANTFYSDVPSGFNTTGFFTGTSVANATAVGVVTINQNFPFPSDDFNNTGFTGRWVGLGVRIRYLGTELNRGGRCVPIRMNRQGQELFGADATDFLAQPEIPSMACTRSWKSVTLVPRGAGPYIGVTGATQAVAMLSGDTDYSFGTTPYTSVASTRGFDLGWWVDGTNPGNSFEWEIYGHYEFAAAGGGLSPDGITPSHSDMPGVSAIRNAIESNLPVGDAPAALNHALKFLKDYAPADISHVAGAGMAGMKLLGWH